MISEFHLRGWQRIPEVEIVALGNRTVSRAEARRDRFFPQAAVYGDLRSMLEEARLDFVDILTVPTLHPEHCRIAGAAGVHILCQKPLCESLEEARGLAAEFADSPKLFAVHENHRYRPWFRRVAALAAEGAFGTVRLLRLEQHDATEPPERYKAEAPRGVLLEYGTHLVDMVLALWGLPDRAYARLQRANPKLHGESLAHLVYEYPDATAIIDIGWPDRGLPHGCFHLQGDEGAVYYEGTLTRGDSSRFRVIRRGEILVDETRSPYDDYVESFYLLQRDVVDCMRSGRAPVQSPATNLRTLASTFAAYRSAEEGRPVALADFD
jgi:predicted dehydrogenase